MSLPAKAADIDLVAWAGLLALAACFGSAFAFSVLGLSWLSAAGTGATRMVIAALFIVPVALLSGHGLPRGAQHWRWVAVIGILGLQIPFLLVVWAQQFVPTNVAASYFSMIPLMLLVLSRLVLGVAISRRKAIGLGLGSLGLVILAGPGTTFINPEAGRILPQLALLVVCVLVAGSAILMRLMPKAPPIQTTAGALLVAGTASLPIMALTVPAEVPPLPAALGLLGVGVVSTCMGTLLRYWLIRRKGPVFITPNAYLAAGFATVIGVVFLDEVLAPATLIALAIIAAGLIVAQDGSGQMGQV